MLFGHWFPPHEIRSSELGSGCILSTFKFKRSRKNLKIALNCFPWIRVRKVMHAVWTLVSATCNSLSELGSGCILSMLSKCLF